MSAPGADQGVALMDHLPALQVVVPLIGAVLAAIMRKGWIAYAIALVTCWAMPAIAFLLLHEVLAHGPVSYALGGWAPPAGIEYRVDVANGFLLVLVSIMAALVITYAPRSIAAEIPAGRRAWYYAMFLICLCGLLGMVITGDAFNAFVFMEISSLATYVLIALGRDRRALVAAYQYLVIGTIGATFYVIGVGLLFVMTGSLNLVDIAARLPEVENTRPLIAGLAFITVGIGLKLALMPLHLWLPNAYAFAPSVASAFLASTATKVAIYLLLRFVFSVYGIEFSLRETPIDHAMLALAVLAMVVASAVALFQPNVKRMLAYSSVAQVGYMILGIALLSETGLTGGISHLFNHALIKGCLFLAVGSLFLSTGVTKIDDLAGIGRTMPLTMAAFVIAGMGLIGVPGTAGFVSKWLLIQAAVEQGQWSVVAVIAVSSVLAVLYIGRIVEIAWFRDPQGAAARPRPVPVEMQVVTWFLVATIVYFGLDAELNGDIAAEAARVLIAGYR